MQYTPTPQRVSDQLLHTMTLMIPPAKRSVLCPLGHWCHWWPMQRRTTTEAYSTCHPSSQQHTKQGLRCRPRRHEAWLLYIACTCAGHMLVQYAVGICVISWRIPHKLSTQKRCVLQTPTNSRAVFLLPEIYQHCASTRGQCSAETTVWTVACELMPL